MNIFKNVSDWFEPSSITDRNVILGNPDFGKSTYGRLEIEIFCKRKWPITGIDPGGIMYSVRAIRDDVVLIGGEYGDIELETIDKVLPKLMDNDVNFIIDVFELPDEYSKEIIGEVFEFFFNWHKENKKVRKYLIDECDYFIPQYFFDRTCKANIVRCISKGRMFGMGFDFITQNFTMIDKTILKMMKNTIIFNMSDPIDLKRIANLVGENVDAKVKHLIQGKCLIYNKKGINTYSVDTPESPSAGSTPKLGETFEPIEIMPLNEELRKLIK